MNTHPVNPALRTEVGTFVRPMPGEVESGDVELAMRTESGMMVALADGLGHGPHAAAAGRAFVESIRNDVSIPMPDLFLNAHRALMKTRGVVASVVRTDETQGSVEIGVLGNVAVYMLEAESSAPISFLSVPAVIGGAYRLARPETHAFGAGDMLVLCTDGIQARPDLQVVRAMSADAAAEYIVRSCGKETDDAAAAVIKMSCGALRPASPRDPIVIPIRSEADAKWVSDATRGFAKRLGMPLRSQWEMAIVATEVAINVLRQSRKATASLRHVDTPIEALVLEVSDEGPGLPDIQQASAGAGMLHRLSDEVTVESEPGRGTRIRAIKYVKIR